MAKARPVRNLPPSGNDDGRSSGAEPRSAASPRPRPTSTPAATRPQQNPVATLPPAPANQQESEQSPCSPWTTDDASQLADLWLNDADAEDKTSKWCDLVKATGDASLIDAAHALIDMAEAEWERRKARTRS